MKTRSEKAIEANNSLENYCYTMRNILPEEKLQHKFEGDGKERIEKAVKETLGWLDMYQLAEKSEFDAKRSGLEDVVNPIMMKPFKQVADQLGIAEGRTAHHDIEEVRAGTVASPR